jgi:hypothetical protein
MAKRLFAVYVGGTVPGCHVELHDMRFAVGETIEDCHEALIAEWWGSAESLHLDAWGPLEWADGHRIEIGAGGATDMRLWFLNLGGYDPADFTELHRNLFIVAPDWRSAKARALETVRDWTSPHKDFAFEVEAAIDVAAAAAGAQIRLTPSPERVPFRFEARYVPIGRRHTSASQ